MDSLVLVSAEGIKTTSSVLCGTEQVAVSMDLRMISLVWIQCQHQRTTYRRDTKEVNIFWSAQR